MKTTLFHGLAIMLAGILFTPSITRAQAPAPAPGAGPAPGMARRGGGFGRGGGPAADVPAERTDNNSHLAHQDLLDKAKKGGIDVYFEGDSITRRWGCNDKSGNYASFLANWNKNFFGWNAADFGWGADALQNILWRLDNGELDGVNPKVIVFLGGVNNINGALSDAGVSNVVNGIKKCLDVCQEKAPNAVIILTAIFPRSNPGATPTITKVNEAISKFADGKKIRFLNVNEKLADANGTGAQFPGMFVDGTHPTLQGYQIWADGLKPILTELLGPPAKTDHAPPPTGDPSSK